MKKLILIYITLAGFLLSCNNKISSFKEGVTIINIETQNSLDAPVFYNAHLVELETTEESILEDITKVIPIENKLVILSFPGNGNVFIFNDQGHFVTKIPRGPGPEEVGYPVDIAVEENIICVLDRYNTIKEFDLEGNFLTKTELNSPVWSIESVGEKNYLLFDPNSSSKTEYYVQFVTNEDNTISYIPKYMNKKLFSSNNFFTKVDRNNTLISCIFTDTIYNFNLHTKEVMPIYSIDTKRKSANTQTQLNKVEGLGDYIKYAKERDLITGPQDVTCLKDNLFFSLNGKSYYYVIYNTKQKEVKLYTHLLNELPNNYVSSGRTNDNIIYAYDRSWLKEHFQKNPDPQTTLGKKIKSLADKEEENPILFFLSL